WPAWPLARGVRQASSGTPVGIQPREAGSSAAITVTAGRASAAESPVSSGPQPALIARWMVAREGAIARSPAPEPAPDRIADRTAGRAQLRARPLRGGTGDGDLADQAHRLLPAEDLQRGAHPGGPGQRARLRHPARPERAGAPPAPRAGGERP